MLSDFFQIGPVIGTPMYGVYDPRLIALSYLVAVFASYIALDFAGRLRDQRNTASSNLFWLVGGAIAMGAGIWSMHFIGMLSFSMPGMTMNYDIFWTGLSLLVAILASGFALYLLKVKVINFFHLAIGGIILGCAIASMHYTGMQAMEMNMDIHYIPSIFALSLIIAVVASEAALWLAIKSNQVILKMRLRLKLISAAIMGIGICGMHYTGMAAAIFTPRLNAGYGIGSVDPTILAITISGITFVILGIAFFASTYKEAINQQQLDLARQLGMAEVAASILHNVGNVLNSVNVSANLVAEKVQGTKFDELDSLCKLIGTHKHDLGDFLQKDPQGSKIPEFLMLLSNHWHKDLNFISAEAQSLVKNIQHIKNIISVQQGLSKDATTETIVSIDDLINESLLISGLSADDDQNEFMIKRELCHLKPVMVDKVKLMQILVNIITNAKEALKESSHGKSKTLVVATTLKDNKKIILQFTDNGVGISPENIKNVFVYGFTTKKTGHGFGLHASALAANELGGHIRAESPGLDQGTTFTLELPYRLPAK